MNCLNNIELQSYIDNELDIITTKNVQSHIESCNKCSEQYDELLEDIRNINESISEIEIPSFNIPPIDNLVKNQQSTTKTHRLSTLVKFAAAIVFLIVSFSVVNNYYKHSGKSIENELIIYELANDSDPNEQWHNSEFVVTLSSANDEIILSVIMDNSN